MHDQGAVHGRGTEAVTRGLIDRLGTEEGRRALELASTFDDPSGLAAASALRALVDPELASAVLTQTELRRRARTKFGDRAATMLFTRDGLEQATRPDVAAQQDRKSVV